MCEKIYQLICVNFTHYHKTTTYANLVTLGLVRIIIYVRTCKMRKEEWSLITSEQCDRWPVNIDKEANIMFKIGMKNGHS